MKLKPTNRLFAGLYPCGIVYADRGIEEHGDYKKIAFLPYDTLKLEVYAPESPLMTSINADVSKYQKGQSLQIAGNCTIILGGAIK